MTIQAERLCFICGASPDQAQIEVCTVCFRPFCGDCGKKAAGRRFCSDRCGVSYFHADDDSDERTEEGDYEE